MNQIRCLPKHSPPALRSHSGSGHILVGTLLERFRGKEQPTVGTVDEMQVAAGIIEHNAGHVRTIGDMQAVEQLAQFELRLQPGFES